MNRIGNEREMLVVRQRIYMKVLFKRGMRHIYSKRRRKETATPPSILLVSEVSVANSIETTLRIGLKPKRALICCFGELIIMRCNTYL